MVYKAELHPAPSQVPNILPSRPSTPTRPAHHAVKMRGHAVVPRVLDALPRARKPQEVQPEADFVADEARLEAISAIVDQCDVPGRQTSLHFTFCPGNASPSSSPSRGAGDVVMYTPFAVRGDTRGLWAPAAKAVVGSLIPAPLIGVGYAVCPSHVIPCPMAAKADGGQPPSELEPGLTVPPTPLSTQVIVRDKPWKLWGRKRWRPADVVVVDAAQACPLLGGTGSHD